MDGYEFEQERAIQRMVVQLAHLWIVHLGIDMHIGPSQLKAEDVGQMENNLKAWV